TGAGAGAVSTAEPAGEPALHAARPRENTTTSLIRLANGIAVACMLCNWLLRKTAESSGIGKNCTEEMPGARAGSHVSVSRHRHRTPAPLTYRTIIASPSPAAPVHRSHALNVPSDTSRQPGHWQISHDKVQHDEPCWRRDHCARGNSSKQEEYPDCESHPRLVS